jgi:hypothetical protein
LYIIIQPSFYNFIKTPSTIVLKPGPAWRVDPGLESGRVEEKTEVGKTQFNPANPARLGYNSLTFVFLLKRHRFDF